MMKNARFKNIVKGFSSHSKPLKTNSVFLNKENRGSPYQPLLYALKGSF
jgi:hypothetical protein